MLNLARQLSGLPQVRGQAPWAGHEYVKGWGVFGLPFDSGHVLALRVFPENDFGSYRTIWHRDPEGRWSIHVDGPRLDTACPRYYGAACTFTGFSHIDVTWTGPRSLSATMDQPALQWTMTAHEPLALRLLNPLSAKLPLSSWRPRLLIRARELLAKRLGMGDLKLRGRMPSGHTGTLMPQRMFLIDSARARLDGLDLGNPVVLNDPPRIGDVPLPARGVLAIGGGMWRILDPAEYERTRAATA
ncbi:hypothetical protein GCM10025789_21350 [Tessaracoccus lubricantis]|uniref:DUF2071 domain-containing protein n=1 Tax=Tessaracoccus lubricantis TaxID=545543 RepID=A0ABP9FGB1_9ACTN